MLIKSIVFSILTTVTLVAFQNCSSSAVPDMSTEPSAAAIVEPELTLGTMTVSPSTQQLAIGGTANILVDRGNVTTVTYSCFTAANATVANGTLSQGQTSVSIPVTDAFQCVFRGEGANLVTPVSASASVTLPAPPPIVITCNDITYNDPQGPAMGGGQNSSVTFVSNLAPAMTQIPAGCALTDVTVNFRRFGNNGFGCVEVASYPSLVPGGPAGSVGYVNGGGSGSKTNVGSGFINGTFLTMTERTAGWGSAGGTSTQACVSNVQVVLHVRKI